MKAINSILWGLAIVSLIATPFRSSLIWMAVPFLVLALYSTLSYLFLYRPPEGYLGVIYQFGRFLRLVEPDEWVIILPGLHQIKEPIGLHLRQIEVRLSDLLTRDQVPVDSQLLVSYQFDLRQANTHLQPQILHISSETWGSIIRTGLQEVANEVMSGFTVQELLTPRGRRCFKQTLSTLLATRVQDLGLVINPLTGVSVQALKPTAVIWQAMVERSAAVSLGEASLARVYPMLEELNQRHPGVAWEAMLLEWAAVMTKDEAVPQVLFVPTKEQISTFLPGREYQKLASQPETE
jgi:regulator of protease activity HflC (stomatin/prohibitin superfamily)